MCDTHRKKNSSIHSKYKYSCPFARTAHHCLFINRSCARSGEGLRHRHREVIEELFYFLLSWICNSTWIFLNLYAFLSTRATLIRLFMILHTVPELCLYSLWNSSRETTRRFFLRVRITLLVLRVYTPSSGRSKFLFANSQFARVSCSESRLKLRFFAIRLLVQAPLLHTCIRPGHVLQQEMSTCVRICQRESLSPPIASA